TRVLSIAPFQSTAARSFFSCEEETNAITTKTANATGTLRKNTQRHEACCVRKPPSTGPIAAVIEVNPDHIPIAFPSSSLEYETVTNAKLEGTNKAPPAP